MKNTNNLNSKSPYSSQAIKAVLFAVLAAAGAYAIVQFITTNKPIVQVAKSTYDFGSVAAGVEVSHIFRVENNGRKPLQIQSVGVTCGCVKQAEMLDGDIINPGSNGKLKVVLETPTYETHKAENVTLHTNDPVTPIQTLKVTADVEPAFSVQPGVINFGIVEEGDLPVTQQIIVKSALIAEGNRNVISTSRMNEVGVTLLSKNSEEHTYTVTLPKNSPVGVISDDVLLALNWQSKQSISVLGQIVSDIYAEPSEVYERFSTKKAKQVKKEVHIKSRGEKVEQVEITSVSPDIQDFVRIQQAGASDDIHLLLNIPKGEPSTARVKGAVTLSVTLSKGKIKRVVVPLLIDRPVE